MWLIEAYRTQHGPSFAREVLTVAAGTYPDADAIMVFTSFWDFDHEQIGWRDTETGETTPPTPEGDEMALKFDTWATDKLGTYGYNEFATHWRREE